MKKIVLSVVSIACFTAYSFAQTTAVAAPLAKPEMTKEEKMAMKAKNEKETSEALTGAGLSAEQIKAANDIMADASHKNKELKANDKLSAEEKGTAKKAINEDKNSKLKALMGDDKYKVYNGIRKKQKEANQEMKAGQ